MKFEFNENQEMLRSLTRQFLTDKSPQKLIRDVIKTNEGYSAELWHEMADLGLMGLPVPDSCGGSGGSLSDIGVVVEEIGRAVFPSPFMDTVGGALFVIEAGTESQKSQLLERVVAGTETMALGLSWLSDGSGAAESPLTVSPERKDFAINGTLESVAYANSVNDIVCCCKSAGRVKGATFFIVDAHAKGIEVDACTTLTGTRRFKVRFNNVIATKANLLGELNKGQELCDRVFPRIVALKCAQMSGGMSKVLEMAVEYAKTRKQSGHPIGSYQIIQHYCADMLYLVDSARLLAYQALWMLDTNLKCTTEVHCAHAFIKKNFWQICLSAHEIFGGIGFCEEHDLPLYTKDAVDMLYLYGGYEKTLDRLVEAF